MLHLHFAPSADLLVPLLSESIRDVWRDPFASPAVMVPSPAIGKWLRMRLADGENHAGTTNGAAFGCVANLPMLTLESFLWKTLKPSPDMKMLSVDLYQQVVCGLLDESLLAQEIYLPLRRYLAVENGEGIDPVKRVQLSTRIARQFREYEYNRPSVWDDKNQRWKLSDKMRFGIDATWLAGKNYRDGMEHEPWQRDLYGIVDKMLNPHHPGDERYISLPHLYRQRREEAAKERMPWCDPPENILVFGLTKVSHFHRNTLVEISQEKNVAMRLFLTNPCAEFWEDVKTSRRSYRRSWKSSSPASEAGITPRHPEDYGKADLHLLKDDHTLLEQWGGAGKENIFLWCPQAQWNFDYHAPEEIASGAAPASLLSSVQLSLLRRENSLQAPPGGLRNDGTLQVLACPDPGREVEELRELILDLVHEHTIDRLHEIVVYLPDPGAYVPSIQRVFGSFTPKSPDHIPFTILGAPGKDSVFAQGMLAFLDLMQGSFDRAHVFALLKNPIVQATRALTPEQVIVWEEWAEQLGIYRGYDRAHRETMGDKGETATDTHTFKLGITRMLISNLSTGAVELDFSLAGSHHTAIPPFRDYQTSDPGLLEAFCFTIEQLHDDLQKITGALETGIAETIMALAETVWSWFGTIPDDNAAEGLVLRIFLDALQTITVQEKIARRSVIGRKEFLALVNDCLPAELPESSSAWTGGITFAPLRPAMVVPARVIFVLGLDATAFPGSSEKPSWDLLSRAHILGDPDPVRDNRFAFLELLHAARERLIVSYRARDMQKEEDRQPSSVVLELEAFLSSQGMVSPIEKHCSIHRTVPWIVRESLDPLPVPERRHGTWDTIERELARLARDGKRMDHRHDLACRRAGAETTAAPGMPLRTNLYDLRTFFANPLEYHLSKSLGIDLDEAPDTAGATDEPLDSGSLAMSTLQKKIWTGLLRRVFPGDKRLAVGDATALAEEGEALAETVYDEHVASGQSPEAPMGAMEKQSLIAWAKQCAATSCTLIDSFLDHELIENSDLSLGRPGLAGALTVDFSENEKCVIACRHPLVLLPRQRNEGPCDCAICAIHKEGTAAGNHALWLAGLIQWFAERQVEQKAYTIRLVQLNRGDVKDAKTSDTISVFKPECPKPHDIYHWFMDFLRLMLIDRCCDHLPFSVIDKLYKGIWTTITSDAITDVLENTGPEGYACYLGAFALTDARIPVVNDTELQKRARERFAPLLERWLHE